MDITITSASNVSSDLESVTSISLVKVLNVAQSSLHEKQSYTEDLSSLSPMISVSSDKEFYTSPIISAQTGVDGDVDSYYYNILGRWQEYAFDFNTCRFVIDVELPTQ